MEITGSSPTRLGDLASQDYLLLLHDPRADVRDVTDSNISESDVSTVTRCGLM